MHQTTYPETEQPGTTAGKVVYILYLAGIFIGFTAVIGVIIAYVSRGGTPAWLYSHYQFQIRTFWIGLLYLLIGSILATVVVPWLLVVVWVIWLIVRCAQGLKYLDRREAIPNPTTWWVN